MGLRMQSKAGRVLKVGKMVLTHSFVGTSGSKGGGRREGGKKNHRFSPCTFLLGKRSQKKREEGETYSAKPGPWRWKLTPVPRVAKPKETATASRTHAGDAQRGVS